jgi:hypothetical protein
MQDVDCAVEDSKQRSAPRDPGPAVEPRLAVQCRAGLVNCEDAVKLDVNFCGVVRAARGMVESRLRVVGGPAGQG